MKVMLLSIFFLILSFLSFSGENDSLIFNLEKYIDQSDPSLPLVTVTIEENISDVSICKGPNFTYYITGTTGDQNGVQEGIKVWASRDLVNWNTIGTNGFVWTFKDDGVPWQKEISTQNGWRQRGMIAPEIHYLLGTFWITYTNSNSNNSGVLKSISGWAQGPYIEVSGDRQFLNGSDVSLFLDNDSTLYVLWGKGYVQKMNDAINGSISVEPQTFKDNLGNSITDSKIQLTKIKNKYVLSASRWINNGPQPDGNSENIGARFDGLIATSDQLFGPYTFQSTTFPHAGGGSLFTDFEGKHYFTITGDDAGSPVPGQPCLLPLQHTASGEFKLAPTFNRNLFRQNPIVYVSYLGNNSTGNSWMNAYTSLQKAIDNAPEQSQIWIAAGRYDAPFQINLRKGLSLYGGFKGDETMLSQRDYEKNRVIISGRNTAKHVITIWSSSEIRLDGLTIKEGNASGGSFHYQYGGGVHLQGGGETIRIVNCRFENNKAILDGGAVYASVGSAPVFINCTFQDNSSRNNGGAVAIYCNALNGYHSKFYNCTFKNNFSNSNGGAIYFDTNNKKFGLLTVVNGLFVNNTCQQSDGIIALDRNSNLLLYNSTFYKNKGNAQGAVISSLGKVPAHSLIVNCIFSENEGGTLFAIEGEGEMVSTSNNLISPHVWMKFENLMFNRNNVGSLVQRNFDRKKWKTPDDLNSSIMGYFCMQSEPYFVDAVNGDFHLRNSSDANGTGTSAYYFFPYNIEGKTRDASSISLGCY